MKIENIKLCSCYLMHFQENQPQSYLECKHLQELFSCLLCSHKTTIKYCIINLIIIRLLPETIPSLNRLLTSKVQCIKSWVIVARKGKLRNQCAQAVKRRRGRPCANLLCQIQCSGVSHLQPCTRKVMIPQKEQDRTQHLSIYPRRWRSKMIG